MSKLREIRWTWASKDSNVRNGYLAMDGRMTLAELIERMTEVAPGVPLEEININWATVVWSRPATPEEEAERAEQRRRHDQRREAWELETLDRLLAKYRPELHAEEQPHGR